MLCVRITGKHSGTHSSASTAAHRFGGRVRVVDSLSLFLAQGFRVLAAACAALQGADLAEVAQLVEQMRAQTHLLTLLDSIEYLQKGGGASLVIPLLSRVTRVLDIKPILSTVDGVLRPRGLSRSYERGLAKMRSEIGSLKPLERLAVVHTRCAARARQMADPLAQGLDYPHVAIPLAETGPVLSVHAGPGAIGVAAVRRAP